MASRFEGISNAIQFSFVTCNTNSFLLPITMIKSSSHSLDKLCNAVLLPSIRSKGKPSGEAMCRRAHRFQPYGTIDFLLAPTSRENPNNILDDER